MSFFGWFKPLRKGTFVFIRQRGPGNSPWKLSGVDISRLLQLLLNCFRQQEHHAGLLEHPACFLNASLKDMEKSKSLNLVIMKQDLKAVKIGILLQTFGCCFYLCRTHCLMYHTHLRPYTKICFSVLALIVSITNLNIVCVLYVCSAMLRNSLAPPRGQYGSQGAVSWPADDMIAKYGLGPPQLRGRIDVGWIAVCWMEKGPVSRVSAKALLVGALQWKAIP